MAKTYKIVQGNVGKVGDLRTVGKENRPVINLSVAVTDRRKKGDEWEDGPTNWIEVTAWGKLAENIDATWKPGDRVFVYGVESMKDPYTTKEGEERSARPFVTAEIAGHDETYFPATQERKSKSNDSTPKSSTPKSESNSKSNSDLDSFLSPESNGDDTFF